MSHPKLVLASTSKYRRALLEQFNFDCEALAPEVDESLQDGETAEHRAERLGLTKTRSVAAKLPASENWLVLGSDQVCHMAGKIYRKPGSRTAAALHLAEFSNSWVTFSTSLALISSNSEEYTWVENHRLHYRQLTDLDIEEYLDLDQPYDCAGAIKVESYGLNLLQNSEGRDLNSVYGVPILALFEGLRKLNYSLNSFQ